MFSSCFTPGLHLYSCVHIYTYIHTHTHTYILLYSCFTTALPPSINSSLLRLLLLYSYTCFTSVCLLLNTLYMYMCVCIYIYMTARLICSPQTLVPVRVCALIHVGVVIRQILDHNRSDRSERLCRLRCR